MPIKAVFGGGGFAGAFNDAQKAQELAELLKKEGVHVIDTARLYGPSEGVIGGIQGREDFVIDTKLKGGFEPGSVKKEHVLKDVQASIDTVKIKQFDILYLHAPDKSVPIEETMEALNDAHKKGLFKRFGVSNFTAEQVQEAYDVAKAKGWVLPSVYQGNYSPVARKQETILFPTLRKLNIAFYAYSPIAGGFLTKTTQQLDEGAGRFNKEALGGMYKVMYDKPSFREALGEWNEIAEKEGVSKAELAYRWVGYNSALKEELGDAVIFGASSLGQAEQTAQSLKKGPLSAESVKKIDAMWAKIEGDAMVDNFEFFSQGNKI